MNIHDAIKERHSVRRYANRPIEPEKLAELQLLIEQLNAESGLNMQLIVDDKKAFGSWLVHYGTFSGVSNYFALIGKDDGKLDECLPINNNSLVFPLSLPVLGTYVAIYILLSESVASQTLVLIDVCAFVVVII